MEKIKTFAVSPAGQVTLRPEGLYTRLRYEGPLREGLARLWVCDREACRRVGVPVPLDGKLVLEKRLSRASLAALLPQGEGRFVLSRDAPAGEPQPEPEKASRPDTKQSAPPSEPSPVPPKPDTRPRGGWEVCPDPGVLFTDPELAAGARSCGRCLVRRQGVRTELAFPFRFGEAFPMLPIFCFGRFVRMEGGDFVVFVLEAGQLIL